MKIDFRLSAKGIGDAVCGIYTACGLADRGHIVTLHAKHTDWFKWIDHHNLEITPERDQRILDANKNYDDQLSASLDGSCPSRSTWYMRNVHAEYSKIKGTPEPSRPVRLLPIERTENVPDRYIVLAPFSAYPDREWSIQHWRMLAKILMEAGYKVIAIGDQRSSNRLKDAFTKSGVTYYWGQSPEWVVSTIRHALITIGNDSGPTHIAGLYGANAIAVCGQIDGGFVYKHSPSVEIALPPKSAACRLCHWRKPARFSNMCANECLALQLISPFDVAEMALNQIEGKKPNGNTPANNRQREGGLTGS